MTGRHIRSGEIEPYGRAGTEASVASGHGTSRDSDPLAYQPPGAYLANGRPPGYATKQNGRSTTASADAPVDNANQAVDEAVDKPLPAVDERPEWVDEHDPSVDEADSLKTPHLAFGLESQPQHLVFLGLTRLTRPRIVLGVA